VDAALGEGDVAMTTKKSLSATTKAKHKREYALFTELQNKHGYLLLEPGRGVEKTQLMFDRKTKKMCVTCVMRLSIPVSSALGLAIAKARAAQKKETNK
jgi:hypothetical protein